MLSNDSIAENKNKISIKKYGIYRQQAESHRLCNSLFAILLNAPNIPELKVMNGGNYIANEIGTTIQQQNGDNRAIRARTLKADTVAIGISNAITFEENMDRGVGYQPRVDCW